MEWVVPTVDDVSSMYASLFGAQEEDDNDASKLAEAWLPEIVTSVRAAILNGNRTALSLTPGSVPPEAKRHVVTLVAEMVVVNSQRLVSYIVLEGENGPMARAIVEARAFLKACVNGIVVTEPDDPDPNNLPSGTQWGDDGGEGTSDRELTDLKVDAPPN